MKLKCRHCQIVCFLLLGIAGCHERDAKNNSLSDSTYFKGEIIEVKEPASIDTLTGKKIVLEEPVIGMISIYDSILFAYHPRLPRFQYYATNVMTGKGQAKYLARGKGPNEFINVTPIMQHFTNKNGETVSSFVSINDFKYGIFNIDQSIRKKQTVVDTMIDLPWSQNFINPFIFVFTLSDSLILAKQQPNNIHDKDYYTQSKYLFLDFKHKDPLNEIELFGYFNNKNIGEMNESILLSTDRISPDKSKLAMAMIHMAQVNILDINTGVLTGIRLEGSPDFPDLEKFKREEINIYYKDIAVDNEHIYALYVENQIDKDEFIETIPSGVILVFDWKGKFTKKIILDHPVDYITIDRKNGHLYGIDFQTSDLYRYHLD